MYFWKCPAEVVTCPGSRLPWGAHLISREAGQVLRLCSASRATCLLPPQGWHLLIWFPVLPRICFPIQVNRLPRETLLCATLYALPIPLPGSSSEANKQRRLPEALGWVTTPLFNFRQYVAPTPAASWPRKGRRGIERGAWVLHWPAPLGRVGRVGLITHRVQRALAGGPGTEVEIRTTDVTKSFWAEGGQGEGRGV